MKGRYSEYDYWTIKNDTVPFRTLLGGFQPFPAWVGLISCILIIFVFATSSWWNDKENGDAVAAALAGVSDTRMTVVTLFDINFLLSPRSYSLYGVPSNSSGVAEEIQNGG